jgi:hypothetical protein
MLEVYDEDKGDYRLIDVDKKCYFIHPFKGILNLFEFCHSMHSREKIKIAKVGQAALVDWTGFKDKRSGFNYQFIENLFYFNEETLSEFYRHIAAIPAMHEDGLYYATSWGRPIGFLPDRNWVFICPEEFRKRFYKKGQ